MDMTGERRIPAPRQKVWDALNDTEVLKSCIPGCEKLERLSDTAMKATAAIKIGPISARFTGNVALSDMDPPNSYRISGEGQGGVAGFAKGGANVRLTDDGPFTVLSYDVKAQVGGKIAQLGARLIDATSKQMADLFFDRFTAEVSGPQEIAAQGPVIAPAVAAADAAGTAPEGTATPMPQAANPAAGPAAPVRKMTPAPALSIFSMIPDRIFGLPIVAIIGILLYIPVFILIFKVYVFG
ncbi:MAG TPA: carbon monoxide dehydrogenase subunit G [Acetobacteraceae bacterium]